MMPTYRNHGIRQRTMHYSDGAETDYVCTACLTIVLDGVTCQHCRASAERTAQRVEKLKGRQQQIEMSETGELQLF